ncbi:hypothetical protein [Agrococcus sp. HG114]|uniref:hypothetical protein n=1 Tax=Agrococcus sp. HG114 TaxID=2969757 RepID=UPI00215AD0D5|nr:hypothetical protein [Agrococcus sp. HG114]MCR8671646.1 hypothetical protein [Agrococcus sp. HG114]
MTDTLARPAPGALDPEHPSATRSMPAPAPIAWASPGAGLWVASRSGREGTTFLGFVEETLGEFVAVDGGVAPLARSGAPGAGRAPSASGRPPPAMTTGPIPWVEAGARVVAPSRLRFG